jgi:high-affinity nickel-transport protein
MQQNKRPVAAGLFFSLGHSTIVIALSVAIAVAASTIKNSIPNLQGLGGVVGTSVSALFLLLIAAINAVVLLGIFQALQRVKRGEPYDEATLDDYLAQRGLMGRFFRPLLRLVNSSWHMYPIGILFGLGFDTATEVGLLGIAAVEAGHGLPIWYIMIFPLLFTAGMSLIDTTDGILMLGAYGWAFVKPIRKLYFNLNITLVSVLVALLVGGVETLSVVGAQLARQGPFWAGAAALSSNFGMLGIIIVGVFIASWGLSTLVYRIRGYDTI